MIELAQVTKAHGTRVVLDAFDLVIGKGERVVLSGPSGCGKTTILRLVAGFLTPDQGSIWINAQLASRDGRILIPPEKRALGYVFQDLALWPHMTVFDNIAFPLQAQGVPREPLSNLDEDLRRSLCDRILELHKKLAFTLVYVTHSGDEIRQLDARTIQLGKSQP